jgi:hypothetical protein
MAMGSPLSLVTTIFFMECTEEMVLEEVTHKPLCWFYYTDDTFLIWPHGPGKLINFDYRGSKLKLSHYTPWRCLGGRGGIAPTNS